MLSFENPDNGAAINDAMETHGLTSCHQEDQHSQWMMKYSLHCLIEDERATAVAISLWI